MKHDGKYGKKKRVIFGSLICWPKPSSVTPRDSICGIFAYIKVRLSKAPLVLIVLQMEVRAKNLDIAYLSFEREKIVF